MKRKTINIEPHDAVIETQDGKFVLEFRSFKYRIRLHCTRWWITPIARLLWKMLAREKLEVQYLENSMRGQQ